MERLSSDAMRARAQALPILATTLSLPGSAALARIGSGATASDTRVAGVPTAVVLPARRPPWPTLVFMNGATPYGRAHPTVRRLGIALARAGVAVFIPDLAGVAAGEISPETLAQAVAVSEAAAADPRTTGGRVGVGRCSPVSGQTTEVVDLQVFQAL